MSIQPLATVAYSQGSVTWYLVDGLLTEWARIKILNDRNRSPVFKARETTLNSKHVRTQNFSFGRGRGGADPEAICNCCLILKVMLSNHVVSIALT
jgi:hypothetical protein